MAELDAIYKERRQHKGIATPLIKKKLHIGSVVMKIEKQHPEPPIKTIERPANPSYTEDMMY